MYVTDAAEATIAAAFSKKLTTRFSILGMVKSSNLKELSEMVKKVLKEQISKPYSKRILKKQTEQLIEKFFIDIVTHQNSKN